MVSCRDVTFGDLATFPFARRGRTPDRSLSYILLRELCCEIPAGKTHRYPNSGALLPHVLTLIVLVYCRQRFKRLRDRIHLVPIQFLSLLVLNNQVVETLVCYA